MDETEEERRRREENEKKENAEKIRQTVEKWRETAEAFKREIEQDWINDTQKNYKLMNVKVTNDDIRRVVGNRGGGKLDWLNDSVVLSLIKKYRPSRITVTEPVVITEKSKPLLEKYWTKLFETNVKHICSNSEKSFRAIIPLCANDHWSAALVTVQTDILVEIMDTNHGNRKIKPCWQQIINLLRKVCSRKVTPTILRNVPQQEDNASCGVLLLSYMRFYFAHRSFSARELPKMNPRDMRLILLADIKRFSEEIQPQENDEESDELEMTYVSIKKTYHNKPTMVIAPTRREMEANPVPSTSSENPLLQSQQEPEQTEKRTLPPASNPPSTTVSHEATHLPPSLRQVAAMFTGDNTPSHMPKTKPKKRKLTETQKNEAKKAREQKKTEKERMKRQKREQKEKKKLEKEKQKEEKQKQKQEKQKLAREKRQKKEKRSYLHKMSEKKKINRNQKKSGPDPPPTHGPDPPPTSFPLTEEVASKDIPQVNHATLTTIPDYTLLTPTPPIGYVDSGNHSIPDITPHPPPIMAEYASTIPLQTTDLVLPDAKINPCEDMHDNHGTLTIMPDAFFAPRVMAGPEPTAVTPNQSEVTAPLVGLQTIAEGVQANNQTAPPIMSNNGYSTPTEPQEFVDVYEMSNPVIWKDQNTIELTIETGTRIPLTQQSRDSVIRFAVEKVPTLDEQLLRVADTLNPCNSENINQQLTLAPDSAFSPPTKHLPQPVIEPLPSTSSRNQPLQLAPAFQFFSDKKKKQFQRNERRRRYRQQKHQ